MESVSSTSGASEVRYSKMAQLELLNAAANVSSQADLDALRLTLSLFLQSERNRLLIKCGTKALLTKASLTN